MVEEQSNALRRLALEAYAEQMETYVVKCCNGLTVNALFELITDSHTGCVSLH